jgi:hypothetical protein
MDALPEAPAEWDERQLCPDGGCVGVIGDDGTCKVCGRVAPGWGDERQRGLHVPDPAEILEAPVTDTVSTEAAPSDGAEGSGGEWDDRKLCDDGGCVGVIGDDGRCTVCGKPPAA